MEAPCFFQLISRKRTDFYKALHLAGKLIYTGRIIAGAGFLSGETNRPEMIEKYRFGRMKIDGKEFRNDLVLCRGKVHPGWRRKQSHRLIFEDLKSTMESCRPNVLVIGTGKWGRMKVSEDVYKACSTKNIEVVVNRTGKAVIEWNGRNSAGNLQIMGAFHLTC